MRARAFPILTIFVIVTMALIVTFWFAGETRASVHATDLAGLNDLPTISDIQPDTAPNDLDTLVVISGTDFTAGMSGTQVITPPMVILA